jgi:hypothetical protein
VPLADAAPAGLVEGWNKALENILTDFGRDLAVALKPGADTPAPAPANPL